MEPLFTREKNDNLHVSIGTNKIGAIVGVICYRQSHPAHERAIKKEFINKVYPSSKCTT